LVALTFLIWSGLKKFQWPNKYKEAFMACRAIHPVHPFPLRLLSCFIFLAWLMPLMLVGTPAPAVANNRGLAVQGVTTEDGQALNLYDRSYALLVGISDYEGRWPRLEHIPAELARVKKTLAGQGFEVVTVMNPDARQLKNAFNNFIYEHGYQKQNRLLFYYAGHGYTMGDGQKGYLVPVNAPDPRKKAVDFKRKALDMNLILAWCRQMEARHALFLFDSCFSGTIFKQRDLPEMPPAINRLTARPVRQFITAGSAGETVPAKSTFTPAFVDALTHGLGDLNDDGYVSGTELGLYLQDEVPRHVGQTPQYGKIRDYDLSRGDFILLAGGSTVVTKPQRKGDEADQGTLKIRTDPEGADIYVNERHQGPAPVSLSGLPPDRYRIRAVKEGYGEQVRQVRVRAGRTASVGLYLEKAVQTARLYVHSTPADSRVRLMNSKKAYHPGIELAPGRYQIRVEKEGYEAEQRSERLQAGEDLDLYIDLAPVPGPAKPEKRPEFTGQKPGRGVTVQPACATWTTGLFQATLYSRALEDLGYTVKDYKKISSPVFYRGLAKGQYDFWANGWFPLHEEFLPHNWEESISLAGTVAKAGALQGYLVSREHAQRYDITSLNDFKRPEVKAAFDENGDGKADLVACPHGWGCEKTISFHMEAYDLEHHINPIQTGYSAGMADALARYADGEPVFFYTWTPSWTVHRLKPGQDVVWINVPEIVPKADQKGLAHAMTAHNVAGTVTDPCKMGFVANDLRVVANKEFLENNPAAKKMFALMSIALDDIVAQNNKMFQGEDKPADIENHVDQWIRNHRGQWNAWLSAAAAAVD